VRPLPGFALIALAACGDAPPPRAGAADTAATPGFEPPVLLNPETPVNYPRALYEDGVEGTVILRLFVDEQGRVVTDSTRVVEGSGYPALDSAALAGVPAFEYAPARRDGSPIATPFLQPIHFNRANGGAPPGTP
jgi:protein TonB